MIAEARAASSPSREPAGLTTYEIDEPTGIDDTDATTGGGVDKEST